jgi:hypothetical protein
VLETLHLKLCAPQLYPDLQGHSGWSRTFLSGRVHSTLQVSDGVFVLLTEDMGMELDQDKIDDVVLALLYLGLHDGARAWKSFDWDAMDRLHEKGYISNPQSKAKSVVFTEEGLERAPKLLEALFGKRP